FQAEDGIRDLIVTGVQTCALPISEFQFCLKWWRFETLGDSRVAEAAASATATADLVIVSTRAGRDLPRKVKRWMQTCLKNRKPRSEERRVGKEWRSRWWTDA